MQGDSSAPDSRVIDNGQAARSLLMIVPRTRLDLYQSLKQSFIDDAKVQVILDRRFRDRRAGAAPHEPDRRRTDRRRRLDMEADLKAGRWVTVPVMSGGVDLLDPDTQAILFLCCGEHLVGCPKCQNTYRLRWVPRTDRGLYSCPLCATDLTSAVLAHTHTCWYWTTRGAGRKQLAKVNRPNPSGDAATG